MNLYENLSITSYYLLCPLEMWSFKDLLLLEEQEGSVNFKFGVIYAEEGQTTDDEMLSNGEIMKQKINLKTRCSKHGEKIMPRIIMAS